MAQIGSSTFGGLDLLQSAEQKLDKLPSTISTFCGMSPNSMVYKPRVVDGELRQRLAAMGAVVIEGPKACGKTETARRVAASEVLLDTDENARQAVSVDPGLVLEGE
ncbi:MAG: hypothetical protein LC790_16410, partial [Actinobacteria bacterium]|nr:hypothetical protein [Actinomycetota bacterium]